MVFRSAAARHRPARRLGRPAPTARAAAPAVLLAVVFSLALPVQAAPRVVELDPDDCSVSFRLRATGHEVRGTFRVEAGRVRFDTSTGTASGEIRVDARSAATGNKRRDRKMHGKVLESEAHPAFLFRAERIAGTVPEHGSAELELIGTVEVRGSEHPLTLPLSVEVDGGRVAATAELEVPYVAWGMEDPSVLFLRVAKEVQVSVSAAGRLVDPAPADAPQP